MVRKTRMRSKNRRSRKTGGRRRSRKTGGRRRSRKTGGRRRSRKTRKNRRKRMKGGAASRILEDSQRKNLSGVESSRMEVIRVRDALNNWDEDKNKQALEFIRQRDVVGKSRLIGLRATAAAKSAAIAATANQFQLDDLFINELDDAWERGWRGDEAVTVARNYFSAQENDIFANEFESARGFQGEARYSVARRAVADRLMGAATAKEQANYGQDRRR